MAVLPDQLRILADGWADDVAYRVLGGGEITFGEWHEESNRLARGLQAHGIEPGQRVALLFEPGDLLRNLVAYVAVHKAGAVNVPVNTYLSRSEVARLMGHAEPSAAIVSEPHLDLVAGIDPDPFDLVIATAENDRGYPTWDKILADDREDVQADIDRDDMADIVYTSGTTGTPKGVVTRHRNAAQIPIGEPVWNGMHWFHASPPFTVAGLSFIYVPMRIGMTGVYLPRFDPEVFLREVEAGRIDMAFLVPAMVEMLLARDDLEDRDLSGLQLVTVGSAPIASTSLQRLDELLPNGSVLNSFALTESGSAHIVMPADQVAERPGSVGRPLGDDVQIRIVDEEGDEVPTGETGEVLLRNPGREREYFRDPEATRETWKDGWLHTGDLGRVDEDGFLYISGRKKDVIIRGGFNVHAADVEAALQDHPEVVEVAVAGVPHDVLGEQVAAFVVPSRPDALDAEGLRRFARERLAGHAVPDRIVFRSELPRNAAGKVVKTELHQQP